MFNNHFPFDHFFEVFCGVNTSEVEHRRSQDFGWGGQPQITFNGVIINFRKKNEFFMGKRFCRLEDQKPRPVCLQLTRILLEVEDLNQKCKCVNWGMCVSKVGDVCE